MALKTRQKENYNEFIEAFLEELEANFKHWSEQWEAIKNVKITGLWCPISDMKFEILKQKEVREELNRRSKNFIIDDIAFREEFEKLADGLIHVSLKDAESYYGKR